MPYLRTHSGFSNPIDSLRTAETAITKFRTVVLQQNFALALVVLLGSACSGPTPADKPAASADNAATRAIAATVAAANEKAEGEGESGSGTLSFQLKPGAALTLPVTFCAGHGTILTIAGKEGETQVDLRVIELATLRDGKPLKEVAEAGYRFNGSDQGRNFFEIWQTRSMDEVTRDGNTTRVRGKMYGLRSYSKGNGVGTTAESIGERDFSLDVTCSPP